MLTLFLVFIITKGALTLYEGNTIEGGAIRGGDTAQYSTAYKLCALVDIHKTLIVLCCVPYL